MTADLTLLKKEKAQPYFEFCVRSSFYLFFRYLYTHTHTKFVLFEGIVRQIDQLESEKVKSTKAEQCRERYAHRTQNSEESKLEN